MKAKKILRYFIIVTIILVIFAAIGKRAGWFGKDLVYKVSTEPAQKRSIVETITAKGKVQPEKEVKISSDVSGEIVDLFVREGDEVKQGDLLIKIKPDIYISALDRMKASLNSTKANLDNAKARLAQTEAQFTQTELSFKRNKGLFEKGAISQSEFDNAKSQYEMGKADVEAAKQNVKAAEFAVSSAEASLKEADENLTKTSIYAPIGGTISKLNVEKGERVVGTIQMAGTEMLRIANLNLMEVKVEVNENDIVRVKLYDTALIEVDAYLNQKFKGVVTEISNSANTQGVASDQITNFDVKVRILQESYKNLIPADNLKFYPFRPGMSATVDIQTKHVFDVLSVPIEAVTTRIDSTKNKGANGKIKEVKTDEKIKEIIFVYKDNKVMQREVKTGIQDNNFIEILTGLSDKEEVVVAPYSAISKKLRDSLQVIKVDKKNLFDEY
ncbi:MAG: efflux RND transporter periplasmic adaptor subunit [Bacteroidia bacterium]|nr:efflux RND transporter periplasmic adaptor subunit [Bacteroidia bacterium]